MRKKERKCSDFLAVAIQKVFLQMPRMVELAVALLTVA